MKRFEMGVNIDYLKMKYKMIRVVIKINCYVVYLLVYLDFFFNDSKNR